MEELLNSKRTHDMSRDLNQSGDGFIQPRSQGLSLPAPKSSRGRGERDPGNEVGFH